MHWRDASGCRAHGSHVTLRPATATRPSPPGLPRPGCCPPGSESARGQAVVVALSTGPGTSPAPLHGHHTPSSLGGPGTTAVVTPGPDELSPEATRVQPSPLDTATLQPPASPEGHPAAREASGGAYDSPCPPPDPEPAYELLPSSRTRRWTVAAVRPPLSHCRPGS